MSSDSQHIDVAECYQRGIKVITCPDQPADTKAQLTIALVLLTLEASLTDEEKKFNIELRAMADVTGSMAKDESKSRRPLLQRRQSEELLAFQWTNGKPGNTNCLTWRNIVQKTFGIYGLTTTGMSLARLLKTLGVGQVKVADLEIPASVQDDADDAGYEIVEVGELLATSDIMCVCGSSEEKAEKLFCRLAFEKMKREAILVTTQSEEPEVDYVDLYDALRDGHIKAAGLNDCNQVPVPFKTPLQGLKNCVFLPQSQESVYDMRHQVSVLVAKKLVAALQSAV